MANQAQNQSILPDKYVNNKIPIEAIIGLKEQNISHAEIARILRCSPKTIYNQLKDIDITRQYIKTRSLVFSYLQRQIIQYITPAKLEKANLQQLTWALGVLYDKERLEMGLSTQNIAYADMIAAQRSDLAKLKELKEKVDPQKNL